MRAIVCKARTASFASTVTFKEGDENRLEGEEGHYRQFYIIALGIVCKQSTHLRSKRAQGALRALIARRRAMKIAWNVKDIAGNLTSLLFG